MLAEGGLKRKYIQSLWVLKLEPIQLHFQLFPGMTMRGQ